MRRMLSDLYAMKVGQGDLTPDVAQRAVLPLLERVRSELEAIPKIEPARYGFFKRRPKVVEGPRGLYIWGGVGRGKSMLMDMFFEQTDVPGRRVHFHAFMQEIQGQLEDARRANVIDAIRPVAEKVAGGLRLLCFDEMQITDIADAMIVGRLFEALFERGVTIVTTSNRPPEDLYKDGLNRQLFLPFIDLIRARLDVHELRSETDYRQHRLLGQQSYFTPCTRETRAQIDALWDDLTGGGQARKLVLTVKARKVELAQFHAGVGRAGFRDLCAQPLGPGDYLAIASAVRVLMLDDIPFLSATNFNEAKRFVTLIDALYEARVRLICTAADAPERLYVEGRGAFEFERTASRLREMQAADWGIKE